jgi:NADP-dependent 3-hydroxy acid dehydrogenase YdfG
MDGQKVVLVTGASSGIGRATARLPARNGYFVAMAARQSMRSRSAP